MSTQKAYYPIMINYLDHTIKYKTREGSNKVLKTKFRVFAEESDKFGYNIIIDRLQYDYDAQEEEDIIDAIVDRIKFDNCLTGKTTYRYRIEEDLWEVHIEPNKEIELDEMTSITKMKIQLGSEGIECIHDASDGLVGVLLKKSKNGVLMLPQQIELMQNFIYSSNQKFIVESPAGHSQELNEIYDGPYHTFLFNRDVYNNIKSKGGEVIDVKLFDSRGL